MTLTLDDAITELRQSPQFRAWGKLSVEDIESSEISTATEKHYLPDELGKLWGVSAETIRTLFREERDVLRLTKSDGSKRSYVLIRIPESVAQRVHKRLSAVPQ
jgi:hypothetical protein